MRMKLIKLGQKRAIVLPNDVFPSSKPGDEIEVHVEADHLVLRSTRKPREGWEQAFEAMHRNGDDKLLDEADAHSDFLDP